MITESRKVISNVIIRQSTYAFLFTFHRIYACILYRFQLTGNY